jgi:hypothetical protein
VEKITIQVSSKERVEGSYLDIYLLFLDLKIVRLQHHHKVHHIHNSVDLNSAEN